MKKLLAKFILLNCLDFDCSASDLDTFSAGLGVSRVCFEFLSSVFDIGGVCRLLDVVLEELLGNGATDSECSVVDGEVFSAVLLLLLLLPIDPFAIPFCNVCGSSAID